VYVGEWVGEWVWAVVGSDEWWWVWEGGWWVMVVVVEKNKTIYSTIADSNMV
jgi:hypothetical protein